MGARVSVPAAGQHGLQQPGTGPGQRGAHHLLGHPQARALAEQASSQRSQPAYLRGGDLRELRREPPLSPSGGGDAAGPATGRAAQIASLTALTSSTSAANR